ncbi:MAG: bifunctional DNA-formamidopyrimidine glycosylase/DNA-(apurinic or apyrimidinic site) lyase [Alphaproteobacteria bacterium]|nr:bifunctional DNA-formamidopyrimidine glycosylase/DNA-(apurinic or apyrimidinic site) lyase [Alphaproteobacteria bacterium]
MPELPEVETIKNTVEQHIGEAKILDVAVYNRRLRNDIPSDFEKSIQGATIVSYKRIAKYMIMNLDNHLSLLWHFGMSGTIKLCDQDPGLVKHDHVVIKTTHGIIVYNDPRRFGLLLTCPTQDLSQHFIFKHTGVDPFSDDLTADYLSNRLQTKKCSIKQSLLEQDIICGIGNIYASEILYDARISPLRPSFKITRNECCSLIKSLQKILLAAIAAGGSTLKDYKKPDGKLGYFQNSHCVYNKFKQKCPECICDVEKTGGIKKIIQNGRSSFYCERLQK